VPFAKKMDRTQIVVADSNETLDEQDIEYWSRATATVIKIFITALCVNQFSPCGRNRTPH